MRFCTRHWSDLKAAIESRGLGKFIAQKGEAVVDRMVSQLENGPSTENFEPLMGAHNAIVARALEIGGIELMMPNEDDSERCPLCFLQAGHDAQCKEEGCKHSFEPWIGYAADEALAEATRRGLVGSS